MGGAQPDFPLGGVPVLERERLQYDIEVAEVRGEMAYTVGYEYFNGSIDGRPVEPIDVRVTHVYRREEGEWKIVHRHGDNPSPEQSPPPWR